MSDVPDYECPPKPFWVATATYARMCPGGTYAGGGTYEGLVRVTRQAKSCHSLADAENKAMALAIKDSLALCTPLPIDPPLGNWS